jgi:CheY-like chemotaxis protein
MECMMESPLILVIDDSSTIRKMVECHLSQAGYRVALAPDADQGVDAAQRIRPSLILLDHQLPGTTGDDVCRRLLASETTARIPVVISSAMRNRAFAAYTEFPNVVDQIPKPFTPELLKSGVANALQMGAMVVQAQRTGCAIPEAVGEVRDAILEGQTSAFPLRAVLDFLNNAQRLGQLTLEQGKDRIRIAVGSGRIQAVFSPTIAPDRLASFLPPELADLVPLLAVTLGEQQDASTSGLVRLLERSLSDPRRLRGLLRAQSAVLTCWALTGEPGKFSFEGKEGLPPMFQAFPLQASLPALAIEGIRRCDPTSNAEDWEECLFARHNPRGGNLDRAGMSPLEMKVHTLLDGSLDLAAIAAKVEASVDDVANVVRGLELAGLAERKNIFAGASILVLEEDPEAVRTIRAVLGPDGEGHQLKVVQDRIGAQLLLRRNHFQLVMMGLDRPDQEQAFKAFKEHTGPATRFAGISGIEDESELNRLDAIGLDGVLHRPISEADLRTTTKYLLETATVAGVA